MSLSIRPLYDIILVKKNEADELSKGGIIIPESAKTKPTSGKVMATGKGKIQKDGTVKPLDIKTGDQVMFSDYAGMAIQVDGLDLLAMRENDIIGVFN